jgi:hypothetical protein
VVAARGWPGLDLVSLTTATLAAALAVLYLERLLF